MADETENKDGVQTGSEPPPQTKPEGHINLSTELVLSPTFDVQLALRQNLVGYSLNGKVHSGTLKETSYASRSGGRVYSLKDEGFELQFDSDGNCLTDGYTDVKLKNVSAKLPSYNDNHVSTRSGEATAAINTIRPIDEFAMSLANGILEHLNRPQEMSDADILKWCDVAYRWAQGMFSIASTYRTLNDSDVNTNSSNLKSAVDNITKALNNVNNSLAAKTEDGSTNLAAAIDKNTKALDTFNSTVKDKQMGGGGAADNVTVNIPDVVKIDNPNDNDKLQVDGAGGLSYDGLNDVGDKVSSFPVFNVKAAGRASLANVAKKIIATDTSLDWLRKQDSATIWDTFAADIYTAIREQVLADIEDRISQLVNDYNLKK